MDFYPNDIIEDLRIEAEIKVEEERGKKQAKEGEIKW